MQQTAGAYRLGANREDSPALHKIAPPCGERAFLECTVLKSNPGTHRFMWDCGQYCGLGLGAEAEGPGCEGSAAWVPRQVDWGSFRGAGQGPAALGVSGDRGLAHSSPPQGRRQGVRSQGSLVRRAGVWRGESCSLAQGCVPLSWERAPWPLVRRWSREEGRRLQQRGGPSGG